MKEAKEERTLEDWIGLELGNGSAAESQVHKVCLRNT